MTIIINLFGGPGIGKSTTASKLFAALKDKGCKTELVTEFAKDLSYSNVEALKCSAYVWGEQVYRTQRLIDKVDYIITDCPTLMCAAYTNKLQLIEAMNEEFKTQSNLNIYLHRTKPFQTYGRVHNLEESIQKDNEIKDLLATYGHKYIETTGDNDGVKFIIDYIMEHHYEVDNNS